MAATIIITNSTTSTRDVITIEQTDDASVTVKFGDSPILFIVPLRDVATFDIASRIPRFVGSARIVKLLRFVMDRLRYLHAETRITITTNERCYPIVVETMLLGLHITFRNTFSIVILAKIFEDIATLEEQSRKVPGMIAELTHTIQQIGTVLNARSFQKIECITLPAIQIPIAAPVAPTTIAQTPSAVPVAPASAAVAPATRAPHHRTRIWHHGHHSHPTAGVQ